MVNLLNQILIVMKCNKFHLVSLKNSIQLKHSFLENLILKQLQSCLVEWIKINNMSNEVLTKILTKKAITLNDPIKFRTIFDVLSSLFTDENHISLLKVGYKINDQQQI